MGNGWVYYTGLFSLYMFLYTVTLVLVQRGATGLVAVEQQTALYYIEQAAMVLGFLAHAGVWQVTKGDRAGAGMMWGAAGGYALGMAALFLWRSPWTFLAVGPVTIFCQGYLGGVVYTRIAVSLAGRGLLGRVMGVGSALCYGGQYLFQHLWGDTLALPAAMLCTFGGLFWLLIRPMEEISGKTSPAGRGPTTARELLCACVGMLCLSILLGFLDGELTALATTSAFQAIDPYSWPRLLMIPSYLLFGLLGDVKGGRYVPLASLCVILVSLLNPILPNYTLNTCLFYVGVGAVFSYAYLIFWSLAPRTTNPALWAGMGRIIDGTVTVALGAVRFSALPQAVVVAADAAAVALMVTAFSMNGNLSLTEDRPEPASPPAADPFEALRERYALTPTESAVLRELVLTEDKQDRVAERLGISVNTLRHHVTALYQKTGAQTRSGLSKLVHDL